MPADDRDRPRVLQVVLSLNPGGTERLVLELVRRLTTSLPMMVCCLDEAGDWAPGLVAQNVPVIALHRRRGFRPRLGLAIAQAARRHRATVVHAHHYSPFVYSCLARLSQSGAPVVFTEHGRLSDAAPSPKRRLVNRLLARCPKRVFTVSADLKHHLIAEGFRADDVDTIYNGIDVGSRPDAEARRLGRSRLGVAEGVFVIGTIARLDPVKDLGTLIRAVTSLPPVRPVLLAILGDGSERTALERLAADLGAAARVRFLGHRDDARTWLAACDVYVNSSISEGISLTILEAMAAALPVVATQVGGTPEIIDESCGRLVPAKNPSRLAAAMLELAQDGRGAQTLGLAGRAKVEAQFTLDRMVDAYRSVYLEVAAQN